MHPDEELSYRATSGDLAHVFRWQIDLEDNQAPAWFVTFWAWRELVGDGEFTSRVLGVLLVLPALAIVYRMARRAFGREAGVFAVLSLIGNGLFFQYALDIRMYPFVMLTAAVSTFALWRWLRRPTLTRATVYGVTGAALMYTHYLLIFLIVAHGLYFVFVSRWRARTIVQGMAAALTTALIFAPWAPIMVRQINHLRTIETASGAARGAIGIGVSTLRTTPDNVFALLNFATNGTIVVYAIVLVVGTVLVLRRGTDRATYGLALLWALAVPTLALIANTAAGVYAPRFVSYATLGLGLAVGSAIALLPIPSVLRWAAAVALVALNLWTFPASVPARIPYRDIFRAMSRQPTDDTSVLVVKASLGSGYFEQQMDFYLSPVLRATVTDDPIEAARSRRVWLLTENWFDDDVRATFESIEDHAPLQLVLGDCTRAWCFLAQLLEFPP